MKVKGEPQNRTSEVRGKGEQQDGEYGRGGRWVCPSLGGEAKRHWSDSRIFRENVKIYDDNDTALLYIDTYLSS